MTDLRMSDSWVDGMLRIVNSLSRSGITGDILDELIEERRRYDDLKRQFIQHRTATHEVAPTFCKTCRESDAVLYG